MRNSTLEFYSVSRALLCALILAVLARPPQVNAQNAAAQNADAVSSLSQVVAKTGANDKKNILSDAVDAVTAQDPLALALKNIELTMGENGFEVWRLKARWASMKESDGSIEVLQPQIVYSMDGKNAYAEADPQGQATAQPAGDSPAASGGETASPRGNAAAGSPNAKLPLAPDTNDENIVLVTAEKGIVRQKDKLIILEGDVNAVRGTNRLTGPRMIYEGQTRNITFTDGMRFSGEGVTGRASRGGWDLKNNIITADEGVNLVYDAPMPASLDKIDKPAATAGPRIEEDKAGRKTVPTVKNKAGPRPAKAAAKPVKKPAKNNQNKPRVSSASKS